MVAGVYPRHQIKADDFGGFATSVNEHMTPLKKLSLLKMKRLLRGGAYLVNIVFGT